MELKTKAIFLYMQVSEEDDEKSEEKEEKSEDHDEL